MTKEQVMQNSWAERYLHAVLAGDKRAAIEFVELLIGKGVPVLDLYTNVFTTALERVGELWCTGQISVAEEHLATEITMAAMERLRSALKFPRLSSDRILILCIQGEQHYVGARMVADLFQMEGWDVYFLGPDVPTSAVPAIILQRRPRVVGLSVTLPENKRYIDELIDEMACLRVRPVLLVGGQGLSANDRWHNEKLTIKVAANALDGLYVGRRIIQPDRSHTILEHYLEKLGLTVRRLRNDAGWTQQQLATATGLTRAYLVAVEGGKQNVSVDVVVRLANALGVTPEHLFAATSEVI